MSPQLYDPIRREWVADLPEERVRQQLLRHMVEELHFPPSMISVEASLRQIPHLAHAPGKLPLRRADIIAFAKGEEGLFPLLLIECKAVRLKPSAERQLFGYNDHLGAPFMALANSEELRLWDCLGQMRESLPDYISLLDEYFDSLVPNRV